MLKPFLKPEHCTRRLEWAKQNLERDWSNVVFTNESSFWAWVPTSHAWSLRGQPFIQRNVKYPIKMHGAASAHRVSASCTCFLIIWTLKGYFKFQKALLKSIKKWFGEENDNSLGGFFRRTTTQNIAAVSAVNGKKKWDRRLAVALIISGCKSYRKCMVSNKV